MTWLTGEWSRIRQIIGPVGDEWWRDCEPDGPGVYRLIGLEEGKSGLEPASINRICGEDLMGTLYIGQAKSLQECLGDLVKTYSPDYRSGRHPVLSDKIAARFPLAKLGFAWERVDRSVYPWDREAKLMSDYIIEFGERPPLNRHCGVIPDSKAE
jgi:hypothetical protein